MLVSPTPGGSGIAEYFYKQMHASVLGDYTLITDVLWRMFTYYFYLVLGAIYLPRWIKRVFAVRKNQCVINTLLFYGWRRACLHAHLREKELSLYGSCLVCIRNHVTALASIDLPNFSRMVPTDA